MTKNLQLLVVVVTYNSSIHILTCLDSIISKIANTKVVVIDNSSQDATVSVTNSHASKPNIIASEKNLGFSRAVNLGSRDEKFDFILLLNPDTVLAPDTIDNLISAARQFPSAGIVGGRSHDQDGRLHPVSVMARPDLFHAFLFASCIRVLSNRMMPNRLAGKILTGTQSVPAIEGSLMLVEGKLWRELGGLDEFFFLYGEDIDLCMRAHSLGRQCICTDQARYLHLRGASSANEYEKMKHFLLGQQVLYRRYAHGEIGAALLKLGVAVRAVLESIFSSSKLWRTCWRERSFWTNQSPRAGAPSN